MPVNLNVSSTEPSIHTARDCVGNREKRARLVAFLDGGCGGAFASSRCVWVPAAAPCRIGVRFHLWRRPDTSTNLMSKMHVYGRVAAEEVLATFLSSAAFTAAQRPKTRRGFRKLSKRTFTRQAHTRTLAKHQVMPVSFV